MNKTGTDNRNSKETLSPIADGRLSKERKDFQSVRSNGESFSASSPNSKYYGSLSKRILQAQSPSLRDTQETQAYTNAMSRRQQILKERQAENYII